MQNITILENHSNKAVTVYLSNQINGTNATSVVLQIGQTTSYPGVLTFFQMQELSTDQVPVNGGWSGTYVSNYLKTDVSLTISLSADFTTSASILMSPGGSAIMNSGITVFDIQSSSN